MGSADSVRAPHGALGQDASVTPLLEVDCVSVRFPGTLALDRVSVSVRPGEVLAAVGANGSGKSTLLRVVCGVLAPTEGGLCWDGEAVHFRGPRDAVLRGIALVSQEPEVAETLSVWENVLLGRSSLAGGARGGKERRL